MPQFPTSQRFTPNNEVESAFRERVRDLLGLDWSTRDARIFAELKRLKDIEARVALLAQVNP